MLAAIALMLCTVVLFRMKRERYAWVTIAAGRLAAGLHADRRLAEDLSRRIRRSASWRTPRKFGDALASGQVLAPAKTIEEMQRIVFNDYVDATLAGIFVALVLSMLAFGLRAIWNAYADPRVTASEVGLPSAAE